MPIFHCSAILFDLDGVLVNSIPAIVQVWSAWARENGIAPERALEAMHGRRTGEILRLLAPHLDIEREVWKIEHGITEITKKLPPIAGAAELLAAIPKDHQVKDRRAKDRWAVVTSGIYDLAVERLRGAGLPVPNVLISADDVARGKPDPEPYLKGAQRLAVAPQECLVIEDAVLGIQAAHAAGMKAIALASTHPAEELSEADAVADSLAGIGVKSYGSSQMEVVVE